MPQSRPTLSGKGTYVLGRRELVGLSLVFAGVVNEFGNELGWGDEGGGERCSNAFHFG